MKKKSTSILQCLYMPFKASNRLKHYYLQTCFIAMLAMVMVAKGQTISTIAGLTDLSGKNAKEAGIMQSRCVSVDAFGNVYFTLLSNSLYKYDKSSGKIYLVAGSSNSLGGFDGNPNDGGLATQTNLADIYGVTTDQFKNIYICEFNSIRKIDNSGIITTVAGGSNAGFSGDNGLAGQALLYSPRNLIRDASGNFIFYDYGNHRIRKIDNSGVITTIAGNGGSGILGDGGLAVNAQISTVDGLAIDKNGNVYYTDQSSNIVRKISSSTGIITKIAGDGTWGFSGDGGPSIAAKISAPFGIVADNNGNIYFSDLGNRRIRKIDVAGIITTIAGDGNYDNLGQDGQSALNTSFSTILSLTIDNENNLYFVDNYRIRKIDNSSIVTTLVGNGSYFFNSDGLSPLQTQIAEPSSVALSPNGEVYFTDRGNYRVRKISNTGVVQTVVGTGVNNFSGDGGNAVAAQLTYPNSIAFNANGDLFIADVNSQRIRRVSNTTGVITTFAGTGIQGYSGDGGAATSANLGSPYGVAVDNLGNVYIAELSTNRIRKVDNLTGNITTIAGNGNSGFSGDGGPATAAKLNAPTCLAVDVAGNIYIGDQNNQRIRKVDHTSGIISTIAGTGNAGYSGDGGLATSADIYNPVSISVDNKGNVYFVNYGFNTVRKIDNNGIISRVAGNTYIGFSEGNGAATSAKIYPLGIALDNTGNNLYIADTYNYRLRKVSGLNSAPTITSFTPTSAAVGSTITIKGTGFIGATGIAIGGVAATNYSVVNDTTITAKIGSGATNGNVVVTTGGGSATSGGFTLIPANSFITTWKTTDGTITIPTAGFSVYNYNVSWINLTHPGVGDGSISNQTSAYTISGLTSGDIYEIYISGTFPRIGFYNSFTSEQPKILTIEQWGNNQWGSMNGAFFGCINLDCKASDVPNLSNVTDLGEMFFQCTSLIGNSNFNNWDVSHVTNMNAMFLNATSFNQPLNNWDVRNVTNMIALFNSAKSFNQPLSNWDVSHVTSMSVMFSGASSFNQPLNNWNVSNVTDMVSMFLGASSFNQPLNNWDVSHVTSMSGIFAYARSFNQPLNNWNVSNVWNMSSMFTFATSFNQPLNDWDVSNVVDMSSMFQFANSFNQSLNSWNIHNVATMPGMLDNTALSTANYDNTLIGWAAQNVKSNVILGSNTLKYCSSQSARGSLITNKGWNIKGDALGCNGIAPTITSFSPTSAAVGSTITITGMGFTGATGVTIGGVAATNYSVVNDTTITAKIGSGATNGNVVVTTAGGTATSTNGIIIAAPLVPQLLINNILPEVGKSFGACYYQNSFTFSVTNLDASATYVWDFGDGTTSTATSPTHSYTTIGNFKVHVVATIGNVSTAFDQFVNVYPTPKPSFNVYGGAGNGNAYSFQSSANVASGYIASYTWDFGDGTGDITSNPTKTYGTSGTYPVKLIVTSDNGCKDSVTQNVSITKTGVVVTAAFDVNTVSQCISNNNFTFTNTSITGSDVTYLWNFGDGTTSTATNPTKVYTTANTYTVTFTVTKGTDISTAVKTITVSPQPTVNFTATINNNVVNFIPTVTIASGSITSYQWDFGDNSYSAIQSPTHTYSVANTYNVKLIVISASGCSSAQASQAVTVTMPVVVTPPPPPVAPDMPSFTASAAQCLSGNSYNFTNTSIIKGTGVTYSWDFGDNSSTVTTANATHSYASAGIYNVRLAVTSSTGTTLSNQSVVVYAQPTANFNITNSGATYTFYNTSTITSGNIISMAWASSDGGSGTGNQYTQTYTPGNYNVTLRITSDNGCVADITKNFTYDAPITASFSVSGTATNSCYSANNSFVFTNTSSSGTGINYTWDFGDGTTATSYNTTHQYTKAGSYIVRLTVSKNNQTVYATPVTLALNPTPAAEFLLYLNTTLTSLSSEVKRCFTPGMDFSFMSSSTLQSGQMHYKWSFATKAIHFRDGDSVDYINPRIVFDTAGIYPVKLVVSTDNGCADSVTHVIKLGHPHAHYQTLVDYGGDKYANPTVTYTNDSYDHQLAINNWQWNFGNGAGSSLQNPVSFQYTCGGTYHVSLHIIDEIPCTSDTTSVVVIRVRPHALYSVSAPNYTPDVYAQPTYSFTDNTTVNDGCPSLKYDWNFGDGYKSTVKNPTHVFKGSVVYNVVLIVTNQNGGFKDTLTQQVTVAIKPKAGFSTSQSLIPDVYASPTVSITNTTSSADTAVSASALQYAWDFGDGSAISSANSPSHVYASGGTYTITLTVTNPISGLTDVTTKVVNIVIKPKANFTVGSAVFSPDAYAQPSYTFANASSVNDASGSLTYVWDFGDGTAVSNATSPSHVYIASGTYTVTLVVTNTNGAVTDTKTTTVVVAIKPKARFTANITYNAGGYPVVSVVNNSTVNETATLTYSWTYGDGIGTSTSAAPAPYTYGISAASRTVTLVVTNPNSGLTDTYTVPLSNVYILPVNVTYSVPTTGLTVNYIATATDNSGGTLSYSWNFNDGTGNTSNTASGAYTFAAAGTYNASLTVTSSNGGSVTISPIVITVINPAPVAKITAVDYSTPGNSAWSIYDASTISSGTIVNEVFEYTFTDLTTGISQPTLSYTNTGWFAFSLPAQFSITIKLTVTSDKGLQSTVIAIIDPYDNIYSGFNKGIPNSGGIPINIPLSRPYIGKAIIYPNPATSNVTVQYKTPIAGAVVIKVYDIMGKQVLQQGAATVGANQVNTSTINISNLPKGTYTVEVNMNGAKLFSSQLIKAQ